MIGILESVHILASNRISVYKCKENMIKLSILNLIYKNGSRLFKIDNICISKKLYTNDMQTAKKQVLEKTYIKFKG